MSRLPFLQYPADASTNGTAFAYQGNGPFVGAPGSLYPNAHLSTRSRDGWVTAELTPPTPNATLDNGSTAALTEYNLSDDLSQGVIRLPGEALTPLPAGSTRLFNLFVRMANGSYSLVNSAAPSEFAPEESECYAKEDCFEEFDLIAFAGASSDLSHVIFETNDSLIGTSAPGGFVNNLYESAGGRLRVVGMLPDGTLAPAGAVAGSGTAFYAGGWGNVAHAMSADGTRVIFQSTADSGGPDPTQNGLTEVFDRIDGERTVEVSAPALGSKPANTMPEPSQFWTASTDGSLIFFTSSAELTTSSNTGSSNNSSDLYRYDVNSGQLMDLSVDTNPTDAASGAAVQGVIGTSVDGTTVYFVATGQLVSGQGVDGRPNLYSWRENASTHESQLDFVATLNTSDFHDWTSSPNERQSYLTPDGGHLAFMSSSSLTSYNNTDRNTHQPDTEVFEYSAASHLLICVSCDPSGAPPAGGAFIGATLAHLASTPFHQPRTLSDDGARLFFTSLNPLVSGDTTPYPKIYEYERNGAGICTEAAGCLYLISDGRGGVIEATDVFLDADATGDNVFFATLSRLAPPDPDGLFDVYDARVDGGIATPALNVDCTGCTSSTSVSPPYSPPGSQIVRGSPSPHSGKTSTKPIKPSCRVKARKIRNSKLRARALRRCAKPRRVGTSRGATR